MAIEPQDPQVLLSNMIALGRSHDGALERDLSAAIDRLKAENADLRISMKLYMETSDGWKVQCDRYREALEGLVEQHDAFMTSIQGYMGNQEKAYYLLGKAFDKWDAARQALKGDER